MTDKEKLAKVRAEIERLHEESRNKKGALYYRKALRTVLYLIDSMQEEPVSGLDNGDMPIERWKQAIKAATNQRNYRSCKGLTETRDDYFVDGAQWADEHPKEESVSEIDFEQELYKAFGQVKDFTLGMRIAKRFYEIGRNHQEPVSEDLLKELKGIVNIRECVAQGVPVIKIARHFANWQKQQIMKGAVDGTAQTYLPFESIRFIGKPLRELGLKTNNPVKVIIIKEN